jgi:hypothetical protein
MQINDLIKQYSSEVGEFDIPLPTGSTVRVRVPSAPDLTKIENDSAFWAIENRDAAARSTAHPWHELAKHDADIWACGRSLTVLMIEPKCEDSDGIRLAADAGGLAEAIMQFIRGKAKVANSLNRVMILEELKKKLSPTLGEDLNSQSQETSGESTPAS